MPSRWNEWLEGHDEAPPMPNLGPLQWYADLFLEIGRVDSSEMGMAPISFRELEALGRIEHLERDDIRALRAMSSAYVRGYGRGDDALRVPIWNGENLWPTLQR